MSTRTQIKFCGLTREPDVDAAVALGVDLIGFVFASDSARRVEPDTAARLRRRVPATIRTVALVMGNPREEISAIIDLVRPDLIQFHGDESDDFCASFGLPFLKAIAMGGCSADQVSGLVRRWPSAQIVLFDGHGAGEMGGSGQAFDWGILPDRCEKPFLLAGGLHAGNVATAITTARPWGVDVSSGIESARGIKDMTRMRDFVLAVKMADGSVKVVPKTSPELP